MFTYDDKDFEFKFSIGRIELIEQVTEMPTLSNINRTGGLLSIKDLKTYLHMRSRKQIPMFSSQLKRAWKCVRK